MENYKQKYEAALETARKINNGEGVAAPKDWSIPEVIFPELRKSENERIKTNIIKLLRFVRDTHHQYFDECNEAIDWFEKQGEQKFIEVSIRKEAHQIAWETSKHYNPVEQ